MQDKTMDVRGFIERLLDDYHEHGCTDIDGADLQEWLLRYGLCVERPATKDDMVWAEEWDIEIGDPVIVRSPELKAFLDAG